jgi:hypothetical protein
MVMVCRVKGREERREQDIHSDIHTYIHTDVRTHRETGRCKIGGGQHSTAQHSTGEDTVLSSRDDCTCTAELHASIYFYISLYPIFTFTYMLFDCASFTCTRIHSTHPLLTHLHNHNHIHFRSISPLSVAPVCLQPRQGQGQGQGCCDDFIT